MNTRFVLSPPGRGGVSSAQLEYFESPQCKQSKGHIELHPNVEAFVPKKMRSPSGSGSAYQHCFCLSSTGGQEGP